MSTRFLRDPPRCEARRGISVPSPSRNTGELELRQVEVPPVPAES